MSTEALHVCDRDFFTWQDQLDLQDYYVATYHIESRVDPWLAALGMAREQSASTTSHPTLPEPGILESFTARIISVEEDIPVADQGVPSFFLNTPVYSFSGSEVPIRCARVRIAYPWRDLKPGITRLLNQCFGELPRLGYLSGLRLLDLELPDVFLESFAGPRWGIEGIRGLLGVAESPLFCRSLRPAVGLDTEMMLEMQGPVLRGGFHAIKDDELTHDTARSPFSERVRKVVELRDRIQDETGEKKLYFANVIDDPLASLELAEKACAAGVDGVLVSPALQGLAIIGEISRATGLIILSHNTGADHWIRHPRWGISETVLAMLQRLAGADLMVTPGDFGVGGRTGETPGFMEAVKAPRGALRSSLPIIQGGKRADELESYIDKAGTTDLMIIAATWVDNHPQGIEAGARAFREAWTQISSTKTTPACA